MCLLEYLLVPGGIFWTFLRQTQYKPKDWGRGKLRPKGNKDNSDDNSDFSKQYTLCVYYVLGIVLSTLYF